MHVYELLNPVFNPFYPLLNKLTYKCKEQGGDKVTNINSYFNNYSFQGQSMQQYLTQPQGLVYVINSGNELNTIPLNNINIVALCFSENTCYIRTLQGGAPTITTYDLTPKDNKIKEDELSITLRCLEERLTKLEQSNRKGGGLDEFL